ncbi:hypothetical protein HT115_05045 [Pseudomonas aeruginosa]|uniref:hypothetical protein n=1 Tax=Pseudomonas aeruginosa TaxID=287 RepID=UPI0015741A9B|nr:hypothetical protein [Pseudomonas aeruginosa]NTS91667.1 hypothetical protein [Pseudomonas aeruginosa]
MSNVIRLHHALSLPLEVASALNLMEERLIQAIDEAKKDGLPQGLIVALLHGHTHAETHKMVCK